MELLLLQPILLLLCRKCLEDAYGKLGDMGSIENLNIPEIETFGENLGNNYSIFGYDVEALDFIQFKECC